MKKIEIALSGPEKVLPVLRDAIERQRRLLAQSIAQTEERVQQLASRLEVDPDRLLAGEIPHPEEQDMDLLELEGELELLRHLREQLESNWRAWKVSIYVHPRLRNRSPISHRSNTIYHGHLFLLRKKASFRQKKLRWNRCCERSCHG